MKYKKKVKSFFKDAAARLHQDGSVSVIRLSDHSVLANSGTADKAWREAWKEIKKKHFYSQRKHWHIVLDAFMKNKVLTPTQLTQIEKIINTRRVND